MTQQTDVLTHLTALFEEKITVADYQDRYGSELALDHIGHQLTNFSLGYLAYTAATHESPLAVHQIERLRTVFWTLFDRKPDLNTVRVQADDAGIVTLSYITETGPKLNHVQSYNFKLDPSGASYPQQVIL
ncbi:hypothetical protein IV38_GL000461 [Lactobacillus selangorensis]|uniref:Uncharacterized protein n=1 Tax=Lactobacillus selangorensis TaxID=81857 RepID=A0A0R2G8M2_9LACO|nr:hypothetical protein [Lactobacillus selangorensis]KRN29575.1 hypothetical protein IV38_GL000461 [Lactobacillus selangorensis]KRN33895.1 hypothetical protein IV40_GL000207 [Lactobacillus selangorensis]